MKKRRLTPFARNLRKNRFSLSSFSSSLFLASVFGFSSATDLVLAGVVARGKAHDTVGPGSGGRHHVTRGGDAEGKPALASVGHRQVHLAAAQPPLKGHHPFRNQRDYMVRGCTGQ
jgi:hypothetical protein